MVYEWLVTVNGHKYTVEAVNSFTAVYRCLDKKDLEGTITFKRLRNLKRIKCPDCGHTYQDNPESKRHHFEVLYFHKEAMKRKAEQAKAAQEASPQKELGTC